MSKQTAVEWLVEQFKQQGFIYYGDIEQALIMERGQIVDATCLNKYVNEDDREIGERYYQETYGKE